MGIVYFILLIGPLIFFHELGHFLAARAFGVGVVRFSIGFGPRIAGFRRGETDYVIGALPLGGFVRMVGMEPGEAAELPEVERQRALWAKPIWQRFIITLSGPLANLILPLPFFILVFAGTDGLPPARVGTVVADSPADRAGLMSGDEIVAVDGHEVKFFNDLQGFIGDAGDRDVEITVRRRGEELTTTLRPEIRVTRDRWVGLRTVERHVIGVTAYHMGPVLNVRDPTGPGARAGLRTFDRVVRIDGREVPSFVDFDEMIASADGVVELTVMRPQPVAAELGDLFVEEPVEIRLDTTGIDGCEALGLSSAAMVIYSVQERSPADLAGLRYGDEIVTVDGRRYNDFSIVTELLYHGPGEAHEVVYRRDGVEHTTAITPVEKDVRGEFNQELTETFIGMRGLTNANYYPNAEVAFPLVPMSFGERMAYGFKMGFEALFGFIIGIIVGVWQLIVGQVGLSNLGGPMMIVDIAGRAGSAGLLAFLRTMAIISINLGILNLLPIPVLDGGNLMLYTIEAVKRGPITLRTRQIANYIGLAMIVLLFILVFKNDIERYWSNFAEFFD